MGGWLYLVLGILLGVVLAPVVLWFAFKLFLWLFAKRFLKALEEMASGGAPPMRLEIEPLDAPDWKQEKRLAALTSEFERQGFQRAGDFLLLSSPPIEVRGFASPDRSLYAVIYDWAEDLMPGLTTSIDVVATEESAEDPRAFTVGSSPETGLDQPPWAQKAYVEIDIDDATTAVSTVIRQAEELCAGVTLESAASERFVPFYKSRYAREMDWQIERGGPQRDELVRNLVLFQDISEDDESLDEIVEATQTPWRVAIDQFVSGEIRERFLRHVTKMSAGEWEDRRNRIYVVHERSMPEGLRGALASTVLDAEANDWDDGDDDAYERREQEVSDSLIPHFGNAGPREAFESAQAELPEHLRYKRLARIKAPWPADVYLEPEVDEEP